MLDTGWCPVNSFFEAEDGFDPWTNPAESQLEDGNLASVTIITEMANGLVYGFDFTALPANAIPTGIQFRVKAKTTVSGYLDAMYPNPAGYETGEMLNTTLQWWYFGGDNIDWLLSPFTVANIKGASNKLWLYCSDKDASIDAVEAKVFYNLPATPTQDNTGSPKAMTPRGFRNVRGKR